MKFYFAPLVGVTGYIYRNAHHALFHNVDQYFMPFVSPNENGLVKSKEIEDILPENNKGVPVVPQILTNRADYFIKTVNQLKEFGYEEINLNLGCPSAITVGKGRGAGFLAHKEELDQFLEEVFTKSEIKISIKTRLGMKSPEEFYDLMEIFNQYPLEELIIHPRVRDDFYEGTPNRKVFQEAAAISKNPVCYNGDIFTVEDYQKLKMDCPTVDRIMMGRGLLSNPGLISEITTGTRVRKDTIYELHNSIYDQYQEVLTGDVHVLSRMKQFWFYTNTLFSNQDELWGKVKACQKLEDYQMAAEDIFQHFELKNK